MFFGGMLILVSDPLIDPGGSSTKAGIVIVVAGLIIAVTGAL
jgi:hypothetical protein